MQEAEDAPIHCGHTHERAVPLREAARVSAAMRRMPCTRCGTSLLRQGLCAGNWQTSIQTSSPVSLKGSRASKGTGCTTLGMPQSIW